MKLIKDICMIIMIGFILTAAALICEKLGIKGVRTNTICWLSVFLTAAYITSATFEFLDDKNKMI